MLVGNASFVEGFAHVLPSFQFSQVESNNELPHTKLGHAGPCLLRQRFHEDFAAIRQEAWGVTYTRNFGRGTQFTHRSNGSTLLHCRLQSSNEEHVFKYMDTLLRTIENFWK